MLIAVIRQVAESPRHEPGAAPGNQVALNINEFDITDQVTREMNVLLPSVTIPPTAFRPDFEQPPVKLSGLSGPVPAAPGVPIPGLGDAADARAPMPAASRLTGFKADPCRRVWDRAPACL